MNTPARFVLTDCFSNGTACAPGGCGGPLGWVTRYVYPRGAESLKPMVHLRVVDLSNGSPFAARLPFVLDTGSSVTMIPRSLLPRRAFPIGPYDRPANVKEVSGHKIVGHWFRVALSLNPQQC